ncbi:hypothetical protein BYT27DRAFT_6848043 [Phlegmacium glaucopus]|nr:hypothetical protein BYT27DRAFT_6848043 [Phlegmacium glaucopus]
MSNERPSNRHRTDNVAPSSKMESSYLLQPRTTSSMDVDSSADNCVATTDRGTGSNVPFDYPSSSLIPMDSINCAPPNTTVANTETDSMSPPISVPDNPAPEAPSMNANNPFSALHGVENVYMHQPTIINANHVTYHSSLVKLTCVLTVLYSL